MSRPAIHCGTRLADADDLRVLATVNYGHFTAMRVRDGAVQGLDLHLERLRQGHATLFDAGFDAEQLRHDLRTLLAGQGEASLRISGFARGFDHRDPLKVVQPEWLISVGAAASAAGAAPMALKSFAFVRPLPQVKHLATLPLFHYRRQARKAGCDDALFVAGTLPSQRVIEGSVWNIGFWDGAVVHWPEGPALRGTCESLLQRGFDALGVAQRTEVVTLERAKTMSAFTANANGCTGVASIDGVALPQTPGLQVLLDRALATQAWAQI